MNTVTKRKLVAIIGIVLVLAILVGYKTIKQRQNLKPASAPEVHYHAGFVVFNEGKKLDFSGIEYMSVKPCLIEEHTASADGSGEPKEDEQLEKAHLHDGVGDVVHSHRGGALWGDLFTNINYELDYSKVAVFINGERINDFKNYPIKEYDSAVVFVGSVDDGRLKEAVTVDYIKSVESASENCGS